MGNPWFRLYSRMMTDPKLEALSFEDQRHFVWLLCMKNEGYLEEKFPSPEARERMIARKLCLQGESFVNAKLRLLEVGLIDEDWQPVRWNELQFISDTSKERTRKYRERMKKPDVGDGPPVTCDVTSNVTVTTQDTEADTDTESERLQGSESVLVSEHTREHPVVLPYSRFPPEDFEPDEAFHKVQRPRNPNADYATELARFKTHEFVNGKSDWQRAWVAWWIRAKPPHLADPQGRVSHVTLKTMENLKGYLHG